MEPFRKWATWTSLDADSPPPTTNDEIGHVFISYVREDSDRVDAVQSALETVGFQVWRDVKNLWPGDRWKTNLRAAIQEGALAFVPYFSHATAERETSTMFEELTWAADESSAAWGGSFT